MTVFHKKRNYYSYAMGISSGILILKKQGFHIKKIGSDYFVSFSRAQAALWESFIESNLTEGYWNEYIADDKIVFLFRINGKMRRYEAYDFDNSEALQLCETLQEQKFESLKNMLESNKHYRKILKRMAKKEK